jgi:hypothetical protein
VLSQHVKQECSLPPSFFDIYIDEVIDHWQSRVSGRDKINERNMTTVLIADDQMIFFESEDSLQIATNWLEDKMNGFNLKITTDNAKMLIC